MAHVTEPPPLKADAIEVESIRHLQLTMAGRALYAKRKYTVEPEFGIIKWVLGFHWRNWKTLTVYLIRASAAGGRTTQPPATQSAGF